MSKKKKDRAPNGQNPKRLEAAAKSERLELWQKRLTESDTYWDDEKQKMDRREALYNGDRTLKPLVPGDKNPNGTPRKTSHVHNIVFELVESQVSSFIPPPKVTPGRPQDEKKAQLIEHFLRNEIDRMAFEEMNDMAERTVPLQGGIGWMVAWDSTARTHTTVGQTDVQLVHPKQFAPQPGIYTGIGDMDWFIVKRPSTKAAIYRRYGISVCTEGESEPDVRSSGAEDTAQDAVTVYMGYEKGQAGINLYVWCNDIELEDLENYQARRQPVCTACGRVRPMPGQVIHNAHRVQRRAMGQLREDPLEAMTAGQLLQEQMAEAAAGPEGNPLDAVTVMPAETPEPERYDGGPCPWCGGKAFREETQDYEQVILPIRNEYGVEVPGARLRLDEYGEPVVEPAQIPFYKPDVYPILLQRSVSVFGQLLGSSDADVIEDLQNTLNRVELKIIDRIMSAGSMITLPKNASVSTGNGEGKQVRITDPKDKNLIGVYTFTGDLRYEMAYLEQVYEEARQVIGITDSFQGRRDPTATSGKAKEYAAAQASGRLESKRVMKNAAYAKLYEVMFKFALAYSDEPRTVSYQDFKGQTRYETFSRYDFLEQDADGQYYWNDNFLFSCDTSTPLASNREAMWQETKSNFQAGAFGNPGETGTQILYWGILEALHYPNAGMVKRHLEDKQSKEQAQAAQLQQPAGAGIPQELVKQISAATMGG